MKLVKCDVCDDVFPLGTPMIEALIPTAFFGEEGSADDLKVDICSMECLSAISTRDEKSEPEPESPAPKPAPPRSAPVLREITPEQSEQLTGVRMKY